MPQLLTSMQGYDALSVPVKNPQNAAVPMLPDEDVLFTGTGDAGSR